MTTIEQLFSVQRLQDKIWDRIQADSLNVEDVLVAMQGILDGIYPVGMVLEWAISPEAQIEKVKAFLEIFGEGDFNPADIPPVPTGTEGMLLLTVFLPDKGEETGLQRTFDAWWQFATAPQGYEKWRWSKLDSGPEHLRLAPGYEHQPGIRWTVFQPDTYKGKSAEQALQLAKADGNQLAGVEVLMALGLCPAWSSQWFKDGNIPPSFSALQFCKDGVWSGVPALFGPNNEFGLGLGARRSSTSWWHWRSPIVKRVQS